MLAAMGQPPHCCHFSPHYGANAEWLGMSEHAEWKWHPISQLPRQQMALVWVCLRHWGMSVEAMMLQLMP